MHLRYQAHVRRTVRFLTRFLTALATLQSGSICLPADIAVGSVCCNLR